MPYFQVSNPVKIETIDTGVYSWYMPGRVGTFTKRIPITNGTHLSLGLTCVKFMPPVGFDLENAYVDSVTYEDNEAVISYYVQTTGSYGTMRLQFTLTHVYI